MSGDLYRRLGLTIVPPSRANPGTRPDMFPYDAELECEHGRLAGDGTPPCGCWESERNDPKSAASSRRS